MSIPTLRKQIDAIDVQLVKLLNRRTRVATRIARLKQQRGGRRMDPRRERAIVRKLGRTNTGPLIRSDIRAVYSRVFAVTRAAQRRAISER